MTKVFLIIVIAFFYVNCTFADRNNSQNISNLPATESNSTYKVKLDDINPIQQQQLDEDFPKNPRDILNKAEELEIYAHRKVNSKEYGNLEIVEPNVVVKINDKSLKKQLLDNIYYDIALSEGMAACWKPRQRIKAKYSKENIVINICYECGRFQGGSSYGSLLGSIKNGTSSKIINEIIEKYGTEIR